MFGQKKKKAKPPVYKIGDRVIDYANRECEIVAIDPVHDTYIYQCKHEGGVGFFKAEHVKPVEAPAPVETAPEGPVTTSFDAAKAAELIDS